MRKCAITDFGFFGCGSKFLFFHSEDFSYASESDERGKNFPSRCSLLRQKLYRRGDEVKKIKSSVHGEISKCALTCCFATPLCRKRPIIHQRLKPPKLMGRILSLFKLITSKQEDEKRPSNGWESNLRGIATN